MKLDPTIVAEDIEAVLIQQATQVYGVERTAELAGTIASTATAMARIAAVELALRDAAPEIGSPDGQGSR